MCLLHLACAARLPRCQAAGASAAPRRLGTLGRWQDLPALPPACQQQVVRASDACYGSGCGMMYCACTLSSSIEFSHLRTLCTSLLCASLLRREVGMSVSAGSSNVRMSEGLRADVGTSGGLPGVSESGGRVCNGTFNIKQVVGVDPKYVEPRSVCLLVAVVA